MSKVYTFEEFKSHKIKDTKILNVIYNNVIKLSKLFKTKTATDTKEDEYIVERDLNKSLTNLSVLALEEPVFKSYKLTTVMFDRLQNIKDFEDMLNDYVSISLKEVRRVLDVDRVLSLSTSQFDTEKVKEFEAYFKKLQSDICRNIELSALMRESLPEDTDRIYYPMELLTLVFIMVTEDVTVDKTDMPECYKSIIEFFEIKLNLYNLIKGKYIKQL